MYCIHKYRTHDHHILCTRINWNLVNIKEPKYLTSIVYKYNELVNNTTHSYRLVSGIFLNGSVYFNIPIYYENI